MNPRRRRRTPWPRLITWCLVLLPAPPGLRGDATPFVSTFKSEFHRFTPDIRSGLRHDVSTNLVHWSGAGVAMPSLPSGRVIGGCGLDVDGRSMAPPSASHRWHALLVLVQAEAPALHILHSEDGRAYAPHRRNPVMTLPGATPGNLSVAWHASSGRWVMTVPIDDALGPGLRFFGSTNLLEWTPMGRVNGDHARGGLCELPVVGMPGRTRWLLFDSRGSARAGSLDGMAFVPDPRRCEPVRGHATWGFLPVPGIARPQGRPLTVGAGADAGPWAGGIPWEVAVKETDTAIQLVWLPAIEAEGLRTRSRIIRVPGLSKAGTNEIPAVLPPSFELRIEVASHPHHRMTMRLSGDVLRFDGTKRELALGDQKVALPPPGAIEDWHIMRTPQRIEVIASEGRVRLCATPRSPGAGGPIVLERPGGWWRPLHTLLLHEVPSMADPSPTGVPAGKAAHGWHGPGVRDAATGGQRPPQARGDARTSTRVVSQKSLAFRGSKKALGAA